MFIYLEKHVVSWLRDIRHIIPMFMCFPLSYIYMLSTYTPSVSSASFSITMLNVFALMRVHVSG